MRYTTTEQFPDAEIVEVTGIAHGNIVASRNVGSDFVEGIKNLAGGELHGYSETMWEAREEAIQRMLDDAEEMGGDAVVNARFDSSEIANGGAEVTAYGTAVVLK